MSLAVRSSTYCDRPWTEIHIEEDGSVTPCCVMPSNRFFMGSNVNEYFKSDSLKNLKNDLLYGRKPEACQWCWQNEDTGTFKSHRKPNRSPNRGLNSIHIRLNNVCNFKCRMCNPSFSTTWAAENSKHKYFVSMDDSVVKDTFDITSDYLFPMLKHYIRNGSLQQISISGGEPLITDANVRLLNFLIDNNLTNVKLGYSTNLSNLSYKNIDLMSLWEKFIKVRLEVSLDGWGPAAEYSRTGLNLDTFMQNFKKSYKYINSINCVVNVYSVWTLPHIERFRKLGFNINYSPCYLPQHCNPQILMRQDKEALRKLYEPYPHLTEVFNSFIDKDIKEENPGHFVKYNLLLDEYRDSNFFDTFPMYRKYKET